MVHQCYQFQTLASYIATYQGSETPHILARANDTNRHRVAIVYMHIIIAIYMWQQSLELAGSITCVGACANNHQLSGSDFSIPTIRAS